IDERGWLHSGDLAVKTIEGFYQITGRLSDMIIRGGENIYPREIEIFLYQLPQISKVAIAGLPSPKYGEEVAAFIELKNKQRLTEKEVLDFCRGKIARFKIPNYIFFVKDFPMTAGGKIQKFKLSELGIEMCNEKGIEIK
ncbi:MAG: AMP-binding protein, partial [Prolixibacteraceae bacterium]|nr:AMP-binding protein [Prolixibacteraceae bacterium]